MLAGGERAGRAQRHGPGKERARNENSLNAPQLRDQQPRRAGREFHEAAHTQGRQGTAERLAQGGRFREDRNHSEPEQGGHDGVELRRHRDQHHDRISRPQSLLQQECGNLPRTAIEFAEDDAPLASRPARDYGHLRGVLPCALLEDLDDVSQLAREEGVATEIPAGRVSEPAGRVVCVDQRVDGALESERLRRLKGAIENPLTDAPPVHALGYTDGLEHQGIDREAAPRLKDIGNGEAESDRSPFVLGDQDEFRRNTGRSDVYIARNSSSSIGV